MQEILVGFLGQKVPWRSDRLPTPVFLGFAGGSKGKKSSRNVGDLDLIPGLGRSPEERNSYTLQYFCLENSTKKASSVIQCKLQEGLRNRGGKGVNISPRTEKMRWDIHSSSEAGKKKKEGIPLSSALLLFRPLTGRMMATHTGEGNLLYRGHLFKCWLSRSPLQTHPEMCNLGTL